MNMKKLLNILLFCILTFSTAQAQSQPSGMRVEVAEAESDDDDYSIFTYKDTDEDDSFGYYLALGQVTDFLGADEILGMQIQNIHEITIFLGSTAEEALAAIDSILELYDKDVDTMVDFQGRAATGGFKLGEPVTVNCVVAKKFLSGKRLQFFFPEGKRQARADLSKSTLKDLRSDLKIDIKLHPKQHRKQ